MAEKEKKEHAFNIRDVSRILLSFGTKKVAYDGNIPEVVEMYAKYSGKTKDRTSFFGGKTDKDILLDIVKMQDEQSDLYKMGARWGDKGLSAPENYQKLVSLTPDYVNTYA